MRDTRPYELIYEVMRDRMGVNGAPPEATAILLAAVIIADEIETAAKHIGVCIAENS